MLCPDCNYQANGSDAFCVLCGGRLSAVSSRLETGQQNQDGLATVSWRGGQVTMALLLVGMSFLLLSAAILLLEPLPNGLAWGAWLGSHAIGVVILASVWLLGQDKERVSQATLLAALGLRRPRLSWVKCGLLALLAVGVSIGATALYALLVRPLGVGLLLPPDVPRAVVFPGISALLTFEALAGWTPLTEELFFRGFVFAGLVPRWGVLRASLGSALIFAVFHLHPGVLVPIFIAGLLLAGLYRLTGSLWPSILAHAAQNAVALVAIIYQG